VPSSAQPAIASAFETSRRLFDGTFATPSDIEEADDWTEVTTGEGPLVVASSDDRARSTARPPAGSPSGRRLRSLPESATAGDRSREPAAAAQSERARRRATADPSADTSQTGPAQTALRAARPTLSPSVDSPVSAARVAAPPSPSPVAGPPSPAPIAEPSAFARREPAAQPPPVIGLRPRIEPASSDRPAIRPAQSGKPVGSQQRATNGPILRVHIGRIEVRALVPPAPAPPASQRTPPGPRLSLEDYLRSRDGDRR
jgi:hypothetical protein